MRIIQQTKRPLFGWVKSIHSNMECLVELPCGRRTYMKYVEYEIKNRKYWKERAKNAVKKLVNH